MPLLERKAGIRSAELSVRVKALAFTAREFKSAVGLPDNRSQGEQAIDRLRDFEIVEREPPEGLHVLAALRQ